MNYRQLILCAGILLAIITRLQAQNAISSSGGNASGNGGSASYSIGQIVYFTNTGSNGFEIQGVQQPYEILELTGIEENGIALTCSVYPNPSANFLTLKIKDCGKENLTCQLLDINGKLLETKKISSDETNITICNLIPAVYLLKVVQDNKEIKTFKVIKN